MHHNLCFARSMAVALPAFLLVVFVAGCASGGVGGYITGGYRQVETDLASSGADYVDGQWGNVGTSQQLFGQGWLRIYGTPTKVPQCSYDVSSQQTLCHDVTVPDVSDRAAYAWAYFTDDTHASGASKVIGGLQRIDHSGQNDQDTINEWGEGYYSHPDTRPHRVEFYSSIAYNNNNGRGEDSIAVLFLVPASSHYGYRIVGGIQRARDETSTKPYITVSQWGVVSPHEQLVATGRSWTQKYGWGFSAIWLYLDP